VKEQTKNRFESHLIENREVRIFLSSTFSDMNAERSALVKRFNKLKVVANQRNVSLSLLDLRWGVTDEESRTGKVLSVCLNEIENSHPFFIGLLGSRYGYTPNTSELEKNPELEERYPWLRQDMAQGLSITEMEMQYGVLRNQNGVDAAFFINDMPNKLSDDNEKLTNLKQRIRNQQQFPVSNYNSIEDLCEQVEKTVFNLLDKYFPDADNTRLGRERNIQRAYLNSRHKFYIHRQGDFDRLNDFLMNNEHHLVVTGASGMGKSALIANWLKELESKKNLPCNIIYHFVGNTFGGNGYEDILQHISDELFDLYDGLEVKLNSKETLQEKAQRYMSEAVQKGCPMLIVIDGINQISEHNNGKLLNWLPQSSQKVKYLFSTLEGDATMGVFHRLGYPVYKVNTLEDEQRRTFINDYLLQVGKKLNNDQLTRILISPIIDNTLVLKTMLDELICFGSYEHLDEHIGRYISASSISDFFNRILQRMEEDYEHFQRLVSLLGVSEHGLSEEELISMTGLRQMDFHLIYCAMSQHLVSRNGLLIFAHHYMVEAVWNRYRLNELEAARAYREAIIHYFTTTEIVDRKRQISELAFQYYHTDDCENLYKTILSFEAFQLFHETAEGDVILAMYWRKLIRANPEKYQFRNYLDLPFEGIEIKGLPYLKMGLFAGNYLADYQTELMFCQTYMMMTRFSGQEKNTDIANSYNNIGANYTHQGDYQTALEYHLNALAIQEEILGSEHPVTAISYNNIGYDYYELGNYPKALEYLLKSLYVLEKALGMNHPNIASTHLNIGAVHIKKADVPMALEHYFKALSIFEKILGFEHPDVATTCNNIGMAYFAQGDEIKSLEYFLKALAILEKVFGFEHPLTASAYNNLGGFYDNQGNYTQALDYYLKALPILEHYLGLDHPRVASTYNNIGSAYESLKDYINALKYFSKALAIKERRLGLGHPDTAISYNNIGIIYHHQGDYPMALEYYRKAFVIFERVLGLNHPQTKDIIMNISQIISKTLRGAE
jgi:preprotein translocase subunit SecA/nephrocystin-3